MFFWAEKDYIICMVAYMYAENGIYYHDIFVDYRARSLHMLFWDLSWYNLKWVTMIQRDMEILI